MILALVLAVSIPLAAACDDDGGDASKFEPDPTATARPFEPPEQGFAYVELSDGTGGAMDAVYRVAVFDTALMRDVASFEVTGLPGWPRPSIMLAGDRIYYRDLTTVRSRALDGTDERLLHEAPPGGFVVHFDVAPDGRTLALIEQAEEQCPTPGSEGAPVNCRPASEITHLSFIDIVSGQVLRELQNAEPPLSDAGGAVTRVAWWTDGSRVTVDFTLNPEAPGKHATLTPQGDMRLSRFGEFGWPVSPDPRYLFTGERLEACDLNINRIEAAIVDLADDRVLASVRDESRLVVDAQWSPDASELLFATQTFNLVPPPEGSGLNIMCRERNPESEQWSVLHRDGSSPETGVDPFAVLDRWQGMAPIVFMCRGERIPGPEYCYTEGNIFSAGTRAPADVLFRGQRIASTEEFEVLGYLR